MSTLRSSRLVAILLLSTLWPTLGWAQSATPAGVVTGVQGRATVARPVVAQPIQLKFKDDLFLRDQVMTLENSLVRVLLGGKALVTVRELSTFTITEEPGRAAVDLKSGKIAVGVAKSLLKAGEAIEIRTPNAIAAVRGSLLVVAVQNVGGVPQSFFTALDASLPITVTPLGGGATVALGANQAVGVSGLGTATNVGPVQNISPATAQREAQTASAPRTADAQSLASPMAPNISVAQFQEGTALASLIAPPPTGTAPTSTRAQFLQGSGSPLTVASQSIIQSTPPPPSTASLGVNATEAAQVAESATSSQVPSVPPTPPTGGSPVPPAPPTGGSGPVVMSGQNLVLGANQTLKTFSGQSSSTVTGAAVTVTNSTVTGADNLIVVEPGANASLAGPLLAASGTPATPTALAANSSVVDIRGAISSTTTGAFISVDPTTITTTDFLRSVDGSLTLSGPLLSATNSILTTTGRLLHFSGGTLTNTSASPLLSFDPTTLTSAGQLIQVDSGSNLTLNGGLLTAQTTAFSIGNQNLNAFGLASVLDGSTVTSTSSAPLLAFDGSSVTSGTVLSIRRSASTLARSALTLSGPLFSAINGSTFNTSSLGLGPTLGTTGGQCCSLVSITQGSQLSSTGTAPLLQVVGSTVRTGPDARSGGSIFSVSDTFTGAPAVELVAPSTVSLASPLLVANASSLSALSNVLTVSRSSFLSTTTDPLIQLDGSTVNLGGVDPFTGANANSRLVVVSANTSTPASLSLHGPLVSATNSTITTGQEILGVFNGASLTDTSPGTLLSLTGGSATAGTAVAPGNGGNFISFASSPTIPLGASVSLAGPLLNAVNTTLTNGNPTSNAYAFLFMGDSATVTSTGTAPWLSFNNVSLVSSASVMTLRRSLSALNPTTITLAGPLFAATNGSSFSTTSLGSLSETACCSGFFVGQGAQLTSTGAGALIQLTNSAFNAGPDSRSGGDVITVFDTGACCGEPNVLVAPSKVTLVGPLLSATNSSISALFSGLSVARSGLSSASADPLIQLSGSSVSLGGLNPFGNVETRGRLVVLVSSATAGTVGAPATISLTGAGPLLAATNSSVTTNSDLIGIFSGGAFTSAATAPLVRLTGGTVTTQSSGGFPGFLLNVGGAGGPTGTGFATAQLGGPLLTTTGALNLAGGLLQVFSSGQVTTTGSTSPVAFLDGGSHTIAGTVTNSPSMFSLSGRNTATAVDAESGLSLGTDRPIQGALQPDGTRPVLTPLLETSGATVTGQKALRIDNALLEATAPLLNLTPKGSTQSVLTTTGTNALDLTFAARVSALGGSVVRLDNSVLNVNGGSLVNVNASKLSVAGDLVNLVNGAKLTLLNGPLITVAGSGFASITGGLINFGGTGGNTVSVTNSLCPCTLFGGVPVALQNGALATNVQISSPIKNPTLGTLTLSPNAALVVVNGPGSKLKVGAQ